MTETPKPQLTPFHQYNALLLACLQGSDAVFETALLSSNSDQVQAAIEFLEKFNPTHPRLAQLRDALPAKQVLASKLQGLEEKRKQFELAQKTSTSRERHKPS